MIFMLSVTLTAAAQTARPEIPEARKKEWKAEMEAYKTQLGLSNEQQPKFEEINLVYLEALSKLKNDNGSKISKYRKLKAATNDRNSKMKDILSPAQYDMFQTHQKELKDKLKSRRR